MLTTWFLGIFECLVCSRDFQQNTREVYKFWPGFTIHLRNDVIYTNFPIYSFGLFIISQDVQVKLRDAFKKMGDEFMTYTYATQAKVSISSSSRFTWSTVLSATLVILGIIMP